MNDSSDELHSIGMAIHGLGPWIAEIRSAIEAETKPDHITLTRAGGRRPALIHRSSSFYELAVDERGHPQTSTLVVTHGQRLEVTETVEEIVGLLEATKGASK